MKKLFHLLLPYLDKRLYGGHIRWLLLEDKPGGGHRSVCCVFCGNIANGIGVVRLGKSVFNLPICKSHAASYKDKHTTKPWELVFPCKIRMNVKLAA